MERLLSITRLSFVVFCCVAIHSTAWSATSRNLEGMQDRFWAQSGLTANELGNYLNNHVCYKSETFFASCLYGLKEAFSEVNSRLLLLPGKLNPANYQVDGIWKKEGSVTIYQISQRQISGGLSRKEIIERGLAEKKIFFSTAQNIFAAKDVNFDSLAQTLGKMARQKWSKGADALLFKSFINPALGVYDSAARIEPYAWLQYLENLPAQMVSNAFETVFPRNTLIVLKDKTLIKYVEKGSGAYEAGLLQGDKVLAMNGKTLDQYSIDALVEEFQLSPARSLGVLIRRGQVTFEVQIRPTEYERPLISSKKINHKGRVYHHIRLTTFNNNKICSEFIRLVEQDQDQNVQGYILDLRGNSGGKLDQATCLASAILGPNKTFLFRKELNQNHMKEIKTQSKSVIPLSMPLVVLVDGNSASASEALAGALRDHSRALLVGQRTYGKGSMNTSKFWDQKRRFVIWKTSAVFYLPSKLTHNRVGMDPDFNVFWRSEGEQEENFQVLSQHSENNPTKPENPTLVPKSTALIQKIKSCQDNQWIRSEEKRQFGTQEGSDLPLLHSLETLRCQIH